ncbi:hypothetical protein ABW19_dt0203175 [Dactylella cylindrospora]|nr:hypothetical protein ABW19_dt0203175 [Dactylella cylindrospora]
MDKPDATNPPASPYDLPRHHITSIPTHLLFNNPPDTDLDLQLLDFILHARKLLTSTSQLRKTCLSLERNLETLTDSLIEIVNAGKELKRKLERAMGRVEGRVGRMGEAVEKWDGRLEEARRRWWG